MPRRGGGFSASLTAVAVAVIALGVVVMVMAVSILRGFRSDITDKVVGFGSHITVQPFAGEGIFPEDSTGNPGLSRLSSIPGVKKVQAFATKGGMVKTADQIHGIMFRGLEAGFDTTFFSSCLVDGRLPQFSSEFGVWGAEISDTNS